MYLLSAVVDGRNGYRLLIIASGWKKLCECKFETPVIWSSNLKEKDDPEIVV